MLIAWFRLPHAVGLLSALVAVAVSAAPPVVQPRPAYDPDWPEVSWLLSTKCTACHRGQSEQADFTSYSALMLAGHADDSPIVVPGNADESPLWQQVAWNVEATVGSDLPDEPEMPPKRHEWLTSHQLQTLRRWINNGAKQFALPGACQPRPLSELDFPSAKQCRNCHPREYEQWSRSMHAYAEHSPVFEAFNLTLLERTGGTLGTFCSRCHTPIGTTLGEPATMRNVNRSRISREGITCVVCHRRPDGVYRASGRIAIQPGTLVEGCIYGPFEGATARQTGAHRSTAQPHLQQSQFCAECHDVFSPTGVRLEEAFSEWLHSPAARQGVTCQHCHMGPVQGRPIPESHWPRGKIAVVPGIPPEQLPDRPLSDHTFAGPDYSMLPDTEFPEKLDWMYEVDYRDPTKLTPYQQSTLQELRLANRKQLQIANEKRYELLRNAARLQVTHPKRVAGGQVLPLGVTVQSIFSGHHFPTGFTAERQLWVAVEVRDEQGRVVYASGDLDDNGDLRDAHSDAVQSGRVRADYHLLNLQNKFVALTQKGTESPVVLSVNRFLAPISFLRPAPGPSASFGRPPAFRIAKASLPPLQAVRRNYRVAVPCDTTHLAVAVRLQFRHLPPDLLDYVGVPQLKPLLEIVIVDQYEALIPVNAMPIASQPKTTGVPNR